MRTAPDPLPDDPKQLHQIIAGLQFSLSEKDELLSEQSGFIDRQNDLLAIKDSHIDEWQAKYQNILEAFRLAQQRQFGMREVFTDPLLPQLKMVKRRIRQKEVRNRIIRKPKTQWHRERIREQ